MPNIERFITFRAYGNFEWPPVPDGPASSLVEGCVEIHFLWDQAKRKYAGCVRWLPKSVLAPPALPGPNWPTFSTPLDQLAHVQAIDKATLTNSLGSAPGAETAFRFDQLAGADNGGPQLLFHGVSMLEQYKLPQGDAAAAQETCDLRLPLLSHYQYGKNEQADRRHSTIRIGLQKNAGLRLELALAAAAPQNHRQFEHDLALLAFAALYPDTVQAGELDGEALQFNTLVLGPPGHGSEVAEDSGRLGEFAFTRIGMKDSRHAVCDSWQQWPTERSVLQGTLTRMGFRHVVKDSTPSDTAFEAAQLEDYPALIRMPSVGLGKHGTPEEAGFRLRQTFAIHVDSDWTTYINAGLSDIRLSRKSGTKYYFQLRAPGGGNRWIDTAGFLYIVIDIDGAVARTEVWNTVHAVDLGMRIGWADDLRPLLAKAGPLEPGPSLETGPGAVELLAEVCNAMRLARLDLRHLSPEQPQSALPELTARPLAGEEVRHFGLFTAVRGARIVSTEGLHHPGRDNRETLHASYRLTLETDDVFERGAKADLNRIPMAARWPSFFTPAGKLDSHCDIVLQHAPEALEARSLDKDKAFDERFLCFWIQDTTSSQRAPLTATLSGLAFQHLRRSVAPGSFTPGDAAVSAQGPHRLLMSDNYAYSLLRFSPRPALIVRQQDCSQAAAANLELKLRFLMDAVDPIAVDVRRGDRANTAQPLLLRETPPLAENASYRLDMTETLDDDEGWRLVAEVSETEKSSPATIKTVLLSEEPFAVQRLLSSPLESLGDAGNTIIANYDSDTRVWELKRDERAYQYVLPPQAAGESMDKPRQLEIHDADADGRPLHEIDEFKVAGFLSPVPPGGGSLQRRPVEFRLTPPAELWIQPSDVQRSYYPPQWAKHEIFRQSAQRGAGAALVALRAEFLYGLAVGIAIQAERGAARNARVAEIEALTGRPPNPVRSNNQDFEKRWSNLHRTLARRPERLELWMADLESDQPFAPARFTSGARFALRTTALHRRAVPDGALPTAWPTQRQEASPRLHPRGLAGGALWPIESNNVLDLLLERPASNGGTIERVALAPHGGDADQDAKFANGRVSLISSTRGGFVQRQKVEVIGRIGVFWHRAKHVVVYERTVNPSAQFTPEGGLGTRTRRPVLRKIREYIEILEPERRYPDMQGARPQTSSFLRAVRFNSRIIAVDSAWAEDVGKTGWTVPLWNRYAAVKRPQVYPRPDVAFVTAAEGPEAAPETAQECLDPDNLVFFADTTPDLTDQTDTWPPRLAIDYVTLPPPADPSKDDDTAAAARPEAPPKVPPGFGRFTWKLGPASRRTAINAGRATTHVYAALETLTFMRNDPVATLMPDEPYRVLIDKVGMLAGAAPPFGGVWVKDEPLVSTSSPALGAMAQRLASLKDLPGELPAANDERDALKSRLQDFLTSVQGLQADANGGGQLTTAVTAMRDKLEGVFADLNADKALDLLEKGATSSCKALRGNLQAAIRAKQLAMSEELRAWRAELETALAAGEHLAEFDDGAKLEGFLRKELNKNLLPVFEDMAPEVGKLRRGIEAARTSVVGAGAEMDARLRELLAQLGALEDAVDLAKPWSLARVRQFEQRLDEAMTRAAAALVAAIDDGKRQLASQLDDLSQRVGTSAAQALDALQAGLGPFRDALGHNPAERLLGELEQAIAAHLQKAPPLFADVRSLLADASTKHPDPAIQAKLDQVGRDIDQLEARLNGAGANAQLLLAQLAQSAQALSAEARQALQELQDLGTSPAGALQALLNRLAQELADLPAPEVAALQAAISVLALPLRETLASLLGLVLEKASWVRAMLAAARQRIESVAKKVKEGIDGAGGIVQDAADRMLAVAKQGEDLLEPNRLVDSLINAWLGTSLMQAAIERAVAALKNLGANARKDAALAAFDDLTLTLDNAVADAAASIDAVAGKLEAVCQMLGGGLDTVRGELTRTADELLVPLRKSLDAYQQELAAQINSAFGDPAAYLKLVQDVAAFGRDVREIGNTLAAGTRQAQAYGERVVDAVGRIGRGGLAEAPSNILRAYAAIGAPPALPNLDYAKQRLGYYYGTVADVVDMTAVEAWFGRLGDSLAAMGLSVPCKRIGNWLETMDMSNLDVGQVLRKFAGMDLEWLMKGRTLPKNSSIKLSHNFDRASLRAWVQIDIEVPLDGRSSLFAVGPFTLDLVNARLTGRLRLDASEERTEQTGTAEVLAHFDAVVGGQSMVELRQVLVRYNKGGLQVEFDPKNIKLNPSFQNIQNALGSIVGDELGGMQIIKRDGMPVGVEHVFSMPPMSLMFGTSGVQNIQISNQFQLLAYPDFVISNRFSLAKPDRPFIFSVFIIGGTGWLSVDVDYRPFGNELMVMVEAAAGGSASLGFAFAGCTGSVAITVSMALSYRKMIGSAGSGLTVSLVVLIIGTVDVLCIANATITVLLRLSYRDNGDALALGTFRVKIRISRFFEVSASGQARYEMRGGQRSSESSADAGIKATDPSLKKAEKLMKGQGL